MALGRGSHASRAPRSSCVGVPLSVTGIEHIPRGGAVLVFNHASYMDAVTVAAALPGDTDLRGEEGTRRPDRSPARCCVASMRCFSTATTSSTASPTSKARQAAAQRNRLLVFFPEGTFTRRAGLSGFYLGAFKVAAQANLPVVPGILRGTRTMLRGEQWLPRWSPVSVTIAPPIMPTGTDLASIVRLRDAVRGVILAGCGEPDLGELIKPARPARRTV